MSSRSQRSKQRCQLLSETPRRPYRSVGSRNKSQPKRRSALPPKWDTHRSNLLSVNRPDTVEVVHIQDEFSAELVQHLVVHFLIVQWEDRSHILAMIIARHELSPSQLLGPGDEVIHRSEVFTLGFCFGDCVVRAFWSFVDDSIQPVLDPGPLLMSLSEMTACNCSP